MKQWMKFGIVAASLSVGCGGSGGASAGDPGDASGGDGAGSETGSESGASCAADPDCAYVLASTTISVVPAGCADAKCDKTTGQCKLVAHDGDGDGYGTANCAVAGAGVPWTPGNDCDDSDTTVVPGSNTACGDGTWNPKSMPLVHTSTDNPATICTWGSHTCNTDGSFGTCTGFVGPAPINCGNGKDNDCDGTIDRVQLDASGKAVCSCTPGETDNQCTGAAPKGTVFFGTSADAGVDAGDGGVPISPISTCTFGIRKCTGGGTWPTDSKGNQICDQLPEVDPKLRDCASSADNDCNGVADNVVDAVCQCVPGGLPAPCSTGKSGVCAAGTKTCKPKVGPTTSSNWDSCVETTPSGKRQCRAGGDNDCDGTDDSLQWATCASVPAPSFAGLTCAGRCCGTCGDPTVDCNTTSGSATFCVDEDSDGHCDPGSCTATTCAVVNFDGTHKSCTTTPLDDACPTTAGFVALGSTGCASTADCCPSGTSAVCVSGKCYIQAGYPCSVASTSCQAGSYCSLGTCTPCAALNGSCGSGTTCCAPNICNGGVCTKPTSCLNVGAKCTSNAKCCSLTCDGGVCTA